MTNLKKLSGAIQFALFASAASLVSGNAVAQEATSETEATTLDRVEVTGSRLKRAEIEGAVPVVVIDRAQIDASGDVYVNHTKITIAQLTEHLKPLVAKSEKKIVTVRGVGFRLADT